MNTNKDYVQLRRSDSEKKEIWRVFFQLRTLGLNLYGGGHENRKETMRREKRPQEGVRQRTMGYM